MHIDPAYIAELSERYKEFAKLFKSELDEIAKPSELEKVILQKHDEKRKTFKDEWLKRKMR